MRAYRSRQRQRNARLVDPADAPNAVADNYELRERVDQLSGERDRPWAQILRLSDHIRELERFGDKPTDSAGPERSATRPVAPRTTSSSSVNAHDNSGTADGMPSVQTVLSAARYRAGFEAIAHRVRADPGRHWAGRRAERSSSRLPRILERQHGTTVLDKQGDRRR